MEKTSLTPGKCVPFIQNIRRSSIYAAYVFSTMVLVGIVIGLINTYTNRVNLKLAGISDFDFNCILITFALLLLIALASSLHSYLYGYLIYPTTALRKVSQTDSCFSVLLKLCHYALSLAVAIPAGIINGSMLMGVSINIFNF